jgi:hypothetical protein
MFWCGCLDCRYWAGLPASALLVVVIVPWEPSAARFCPCRLLRNAGKGGIMRAGSLLQARTLQIEDEKLLCWQALYVR